MDALLLTELVINGAATGLLYSLVAVGLVLVYKSSSVPSLAHGALIMLGGYITLAFTSQLGLPLWAAIPLAMVVMFFFGLALERLTLRRLAGRPVIMILMMTLGLEIFIRSTTMAIWGATARPMGLGVSYEPLLAGPLLLSRIHLWGAAVAVVLLVAFLIFFRTRLGVRLRAISDDYTASWSVGISVERGIALSWGLASVTAVAAGVIWGEIQGVDQALSLLLLKGLTVAVLGGLDSLPGALIAGLLIGVLEAVGSALLDPLVGGGSRDLIMAAILILTILIRPHGIFGRHDIERL
ncbi:branched-chain amino acid ABC transporter permease [Bosea sp. (in: a-proteobacteria)]|uniref:branched-chain amino acid ABC transporter permease n=1 Tax=Bosea sp. (in: a-proteobacteria) TaxID=1871050 RepID=UPI001AD392DC|nr:branched-chain amino acid ABC transporter permease [Bosea sp. (in: a-proteobacteria)]MBN9438493.1 branched-chain amino acid ABC transporter permease [Bosea sp. (in: a-proteobacteria)]